MVRSGLLAVFAGCLLVCCGFINQPRAAIIQCTALGSDGFELCHTFLGKDGEFPEAGLTADKKGNLYGTTFGNLGGGAPVKRCGKSCGTADALFPDKLKILHTFDPGNGNGAFPAGEVAVQNNYAIYGTTEYGKRSGCGGLGCGTVFNLTKSSSGRVLTDQVFCRLPNCTDGAFPHAGLIADSSLATANVYGTTTVGGTGAGNLCGSTLGGCGTVYQLPSGNVDPVVIYSFCTQVKRTICADGAVPYSRLLFDKPTGSLYGTTEFGGAHSEGVVFKLTPPSGSGSWTETVLYSFCKLSGCRDGAQPEAGVVLDGSGNIYGTATYGGEPCDANDIGCGVVYELTPQLDGTYTESVLHTFAGLQGSPSDGDLPQNQLVLDSAGNLYGTTFRGGVNPGVAPCKLDRINVGCGTMFELVGAARDGYKILHVFGINDAAPDGVRPEGALLLQNTDQYLYGATRNGGDPTCHCGTYYRINLAAAGMRAQVVCALSEPERRARTDCLRGGIRARGIEHSTVSDPANYGLSAPLAKGR
jgi:uncharacterized repeat protein (TIGR03803 family)